MAAPGLGGALFPLGLTLGSEGDDSTLFGNVGIGATLSVLAKYAPVTTVTIAISSAPTGGFTLDAALSQDLTVHDAPLAGLHALMIQAFGIEAVVLVEKPISGIATDTIHINPITLTTWRPNAILTQTINLSAAFTLVYAVILRDTAGIHLTLSAGSTSYELMIDTFSIEDVAKLLSGAIVAEDIELTAVLTAYSAVVVAEQLGMLEALSGGAIYDRELSLSLNLSDSVLRFMGVSLIDTVTTTPALAGLGIGYRTQAETVAITPTITPLLLLRAVVAEDIEIDDNAIISALLTGDISEEIEITAAYLAPDGSFTTWAMNARTGAVTEYADYVFNSFARVGNTYVGAAADGIYELLGDDDNGSDIIARIVGGFVQFGGTKLSRLKSAYIAARGEGSFILRITDGEGHVYNYSADTRNQRSSKVHMGKGMRARYFSYELISEGQDFDLDTLEFVPIVLERRV